jgi:autotransporter-associated beta strand protein
MKKLNPNPFLITSLALGLVFALLANAGAQTFSTWDPQANSSQNPYLGSLSGTWENPLWDTTDQFGVASPVHWVEGTTALFAVNTGTGTPPFLVTMGSGHTVAGIYDGGQTPGPCNVIITGSGTMTLPAGTQTFNVVSPGTVTITNVIGGTGALVESGSGILTLCGANTYSGGTGIGAGCTLAISGSGKLGGGTYSVGITNNGTFTYNSSSSQTLSGPMSGAGELAVTGGGTLTLTKANNYTGGTFIGSGAKLTLGTGGSLVGSIGITNNGTFNYNNPASATLSGPISGSGSLSVNPGGSQGLILTLSGANTYTGTTTIQPVGQIVILSDGNLGTPPSTFVANQLTMNYGFLKVSGTFTLNANRGITLLTGVGGAGGSIQVDSGQTLTIAAPIIGPAAVIFGSGEPNFGGGTNLLVNTNNFLGGSAISTGTLRLGTNGALPYGRTVVMAPDDFGGPFFDLGGCSQTIGPLSTTNSFVGVPASGTPTILLNGALTILQTNIATAFSGQIFGTGALTINGNSSGTLILSNYPSTYTGGTIINGGTLEISPSASIAGDVTVNGGTLKLDNNTALATTANLTLASGTTVNLNYSGTQTIGALTFGSTTQATGLWGAVGNASATYTTNLFTGGGLILVCPAPQTITATTNSVCAGSTNTASVPATPGATYSWTISNGAIVSGANSSAITYMAWASSPVTLNCVVTSTCGVQSAGGQNYTVPVNICGLVVESTNVAYDPLNGATITGTGLIGAPWSLKATNDLTAPLPWPSIQSGTVSSSPFTIPDYDAVNYLQRFYYLTNSP